MKGACPCRNIELHWQLVDMSLVPRRCDCDYCSDLGVSWVSKSGTRLRATVHNPAYYKVTHHGTGMASFHECTHCQLPVFASASVDGEDYAVVNAACLANPRGFADPVPASFGHESLEERCKRWQRNWSSLVEVTVSQ